MADATYVALTGGTLYADAFAVPVHDAVVLVLDGRIESAGPRETVPVPASAQVLDCTGLTLLPGFQNSHVHFFERKWANAAEIPADELRRQLEDFTRYGFTGVFDLSSSFENTRALRERIESGEIPGPAIRTTGEGIVPPGAAPSDAILGVMGVMKTPLPEVTEPRAAATYAKTQLERGVDGIKLFASAPPSAQPAALSEEIFRAVAYEAHARGKPVFVHPNTIEDVVTAVRGGVDVVAHTTPRSGAWSDECVAEMRERDAALIPTLTIWQYMLRHDRIGVQERMVDAALGQLHSWMSAGGTVLFGTDLGAVEYDPAPEYALMARSGMSAPQIVASLTSTPAARFNTAGDTGCIAPGYAADIVALRGDPFGHILELACVQYTMRGGKIIYRAAP